MASDQKSEHFSPENFSDGGLQIQIFGPFEIRCFKFKFKFCRSSDGKKLEEDLHEL